MLSATPATLTSQRVESISLRGRLSIFLPPGRIALGENPFGKDVANLQLWQALARHGGYAHLDILSLQPPQQRQALLGWRGHTEPSRLDRLA